MSDAGEPGDPLANLITTYHDLNSTSIDELEEVPSALEFMRYVARNRPFVIRGAASDWAAYQKWDAQYLRSILQSEQVNVSTTPYGNADSVTQLGDGSAVFVEPYDSDEPFTDFLHYIQQDSARLRQLASLAGTEGNVKYAQTQNDNLRSEYSVLFADVPSSVDFAHVAFEGSQPDAVNFWLGNSRSVTAIHKDNYENIYVQIRGRKHFLLLPPVEMPCLNEMPLPRGRYCPSADSVNERLVIEVDHTSEPVPVPTWDPDRPDKNQSAYSHLSKAIRVTLDESDMLYLPALWYHKVSQSEGEEGFACAVNYWYDMDFAGGFWTSNNFVRDIYDARAREAKYPSLDTRLARNVQD
ncbi:Clavaminate synthase-like protein [Polychaeton citri CBS 116435]|uniref:Clavaminate synthase-like protein n=1 Tax=Polychaeton citri CBS 116435 TaxID=1314669 RepID=A0A9P4Q7G4_9PEZI|nr:Clavaminate synthase-like protein [Polychaeton citri CBS 116435]